MDKEYIFDYGEDLENLKLEKDAENLSIYIYTKYLALDQERKIIEDMAKMQYEQKQNKSNIKFISLIQRKKIV